MRIVTLQRVTTGDDGTFGEIVAGGLRLATGELPWRDNARGRSCIPAGRYTARWHKSPRFGFVYRLDGTEPRSEILIHSGNFAGDVEKGRKSDVEGCILLGISAGKIGDQRAVLVSRAAVSRFTAEMTQQDFVLDIRAITPGANP